MIHFWDSSILDSNLIAKRFQDIRKLNLFSVKTKGNYMSYGIGKTKKNGEKREPRIKQRHFLRRQCTNKTSKYQTKATTELCNEGILSKLSWCLSCYCVLWYTKLLYDVMTKAQLVKVVTCMEKRRKKNPVWFALYNPLYIQKENLSVTLAVCLSTKRSYPWRNHLDQAYLRNLIDIVVIY